MGEPALVIPFPEPGTFEEAWKTLPATMRNRSDKKARLAVVLVENVQVLSSRSEHRSLFLEPFAANPFLIIATACALGIHLAAMFVPGLRDTLGIHPVGFAYWWPAPILALATLATVEIDKAILARQRALRSAG